MAREETLVPSLTIAREVGDRKLVPLVWSKGGKSFLPCSVIKEEKGGGDLFFPFISVQPPEKQRKKERREKRGRREEEERKKGRKRKKTQGFSS